MKRTFAHLRPEANAADKLARLATQIANTPDDRIMALTADELVRRTGAPMKEATDRLRIAQRNAEKRS